MWPSAQTQGHGLGALGRMEIWGNSTIRGRVIKGPLVPEVGRFVFRKSAILKLPISAERSGIFQSLPIIRESTVMMVAIEKSVSSVVSYSKMIASFKAVMVLGSIKSHFFNAKAVFILYFLTMPGECFSSQGQNRTTK